MTREQYLTSRKNNEVSFELLYEYFKLKKLNNTELSFIQFCRIFEVAQTRMNFTLEDFFSYYDQLYSVVLLHDKNGKLLSIY